MRFTVYIPGFGNNIIARCKVERLNQLVSTLGNETLSTTIVNRHYRMDFDPGRIS